MRETCEQATDGAERVVLDAQALPAVSDVQGAQADDAPALHAGVFGNLCFRWARGDEARVRAAFASAERVVALDLVNNRVAGAAIEPRAVLAVCGPNAGKLTLYSATQVPHHIRRLVTEQLGMAESALRVIAPDVGGGFGYKGKLYPEEAIIAWAARRLQCPVRWSATRAESFLADNQGRDHVTHAELALDADGHFLALRVHTRANLGAYVSTFGAAIPSAIYTSLLAGVYRTPAIFVESTGIFTNTMPTDAYRGAGRPEACYVLERLADLAAKNFGMDRGEIRRRNFITPGEMPYLTPIGPTYDCGDFPKMLARAQALADYENFDLRRADAMRQGRLRGIGLACYVESRALRLRGLPALSARARASSRLPPSASSPTGRCERRSAPTITVRDTPRRSRKSSARGSASPWSRSKCSRAIPIWCPMAPVRSARARLRSAAVALHRAAEKIVEQGQAHRRASPGSGGHRH